VSKYVTLDSVSLLTDDGQVRVTYEIGYEVAIAADPIEAFIAAVREAAQGLTDASVDAENYYECARVVVSGYRPATPEELAVQRARQDAAYERLRAEYEAETAARAGHHV